MRHRQTRQALAALLLSTVAMGCYTVHEGRSDMTLKDRFREDFLLGTCLPTRLMENDDATRALVVRQFNAATPENALKWGPVHPRPDQYHFQHSDAFVEFAEANDMAFFGHTLVWHQQTPDWVFEDEAGEPLDREALLTRLREHIHTVVGRYRGQIQGWDVVNECVHRGPHGVLRDTPWLRIIGDDYVAKAFEYTREIDPDCELYYNDYRLCHWRKRKRAQALITDLQARGCRVDAVGMQLHIGPHFPRMRQIEKSIKAFAKQGLRVNITELDMSVYSWLDRRNRYPDAASPRVLRRQAKRYAKLFHLLEKHSDKIDRVSFWGASDAYSWKNNFPVQDRPDHPLLFDRQAQPKPAYHAVVSNRN